MLTRLPGLAAELTVVPSSGRREDLIARGALENRSGEVVTLDPAPLGSASLALEIEDPHGTPVPLPPPPVPGGEAQRTTLEPGARAPVEYRGFLPSWMPAGHYRVRFRYVGLAAAAGESESVVEVRSGWFAFEATG